MGSHPVALQQLNQVQGQLIPDLVSALDDADQKYDS